MSKLHWQLCTCVQTGCVGSHKRSSTHHPSCHGWASSVMLQCVCCLYRLVCFGEVLGVHFSSDMFFHVLEMAISVHSLLMCRYPKDWNIPFGVAFPVYGWGHNHRGQLGGVEGNKIKTPRLCDAFSELSPVKVVGGEQTMFAITQDGKVHVSHPSLSLILHPSSTSSYLLFSTTSLPPSP